MNIITIRQSPKLVKGLFQTQIKIFQLRNHSNALYNDIESYLSWAKLNNVSVKSTVFRGTYYEMQTKQAIQNIFNIRPESIKLTGGSYDQGVDMLAKWNLQQYIPSNTESTVTTTQLPKRVKPLIQRRKQTTEKDLEVDLLIQCKTTSRKIPSKLLREVTGSYNSHVSPRNRSTSFMMLVSNSTLTEDALNFFTSTDIPLIFIQLELPTARSEKLKDIYESQNYENGMLVLYFRNPRAKMLLHGLSDYKDVNMKILNQIKT